MQFLNIKFLFIYFSFLWLFNLSMEAQSTMEKLNDSAMVVYKKDPQKAIEILELSLEINNDIKEYAIAKDYLGIVYRDLGQFEKAKTLSLEAISFSKDSLTNASAYTNIGAANRQMGLYREALKYYLKALKIYEDAPDLHKIATVNNNIGTVYNYLGINDKAVEYHTKAIKIFESLSNRKGISNAYNNIAIIYANDGELEKALSNFKYSLEIERELQDKKGIAESSNNVGAVYYYMQEIDSALYYFDQSANMERLIGNYAGVGASFNNIAQVLLENNRVAESKVYIDSSYYYAQKSKTTVDIESALLTYSEYYEAKNDLKSALNYFKEYSKFKDSTLNVETNKEVVELETKYETEKKEKEILSQRTEIAEKQLNINRKNTQLIGLAVVAILISILGYLLYNQQKLKNKQLQKEAELKEALARIETQNELQEQRLRISRDLHDNIGAQLTFVISSIENLQYGFDIKNNKLTDKLTGISAFTKDTIYELRDTIWAMNKNEISLEDLQTRISNFVEKANVHSRNINFKFKIDDTVQDGITFSSVKGMNVYRIVQESIHNAIKYAEAKNVDVKIFKNDKQLIIKVIDDGNGFDIAKVEDGNGLNNMEKRAKDVKASLNIDSKRSKGTQIELTLDI